jgi:hypothetical protein
MLFVINVTPYQTGMIQEVMCHIPRLMLLTLCLRFRVEST